MAIFGDKKKKSIKKESLENKEVISSAIVPGRGLIYQVISHPRVTEKATYVAESSNAYTFDVNPRATKADIAKEVTRLYKVTPKKVRVARVPHKTVSMKGKDSRKPGGKKAYVYLKKGDSIEII